VVGHSQGEIAAAYVAGGLSLADAARIVALRSRYGRTLAGTGAMAFVVLPAAEVEARLARWNGRICVAAVNGPSATVVSGDADALDELLAALDADGIRLRRVRSDYASHSPHVEAFRDELLDALAGLAPRTGDVAFCSTVTGEPLDTARLDADYWFRNLRQTVRFDPAVRALRAAGHDVFLEISAHPLLIRSVTDTLGAVGRPGAALGTLRRDHGGHTQFRAAMAAAWTHGAPVDWAVFTAPDQAGPLAADGGSEPAAVPVPVSARGDAALRAQAGRLAEALRARPELDLTDLGYSLATGRAAFDRRACVVATDMGEALAGLDALAAGLPAPGLTEATAGAPGGPVFVFPGQGSQWAGMAVPLLDSSAVFRGEVEACAAAFAPFVD
ncbi:acyltransferase domain-containing protein, partial [Streptomyces zhihengii]